jgi:hypothetical protein
VEVELGVSSEPLLLPWLIEDISSQSPLLKMMHGNAADDGSDILLIVLESRLLPLTVGAGHRVLVLASERFDLKRYCCVVFFDEVSVTVLWPLRFRRYYRQVLSVKGSGQEGTVRWF